MQLSDLPKQHNSIGRMREEFFWQAIIERLRAMFPQEDFSGWLSSEWEDRAGVDYWIIKKCQWKTIQLGIDFTVSQRDPRKAKNLESTKIELTSWENKTIYSRIYIFLTFSKYCPGHERATIAELDPQDVILWKLDPLNIPSETVEGRVALWENNAKYPMVIGDLYGDTQEWALDEAEFRLTSQIRMALVGIYKRDELLAKLANPSPR